MTRGVFARIKENKYVFIAAAVSILLIVLSLYSSVFAIIALILNVAALATMKAEKFVVLLFALMPWAYIYKINGLSTSLFSVLVILTVVKFAFDVEKWNVKFVILFFFFLINVLLHFGMNDFTMITIFIKLLFNILLLYEMCVVHKSENLTTLLILFVFSVLLASLVSSVFPDQLLLYNRISVDRTFVEFEYARFKGLQNDPNYYNASLIISLLALCYLHTKREMGIIFYPLSFACIYFGFLTYSKSFFLLLLVWFAVTIYYSFKEKTYGIGIVLIGVTTAATAYIFSGRVHLINVLLNRFNDPAGITTGRTEIWKMFFEYFKNNFSVLLFGNGLESLIYETHASHNTYIDLIYYFGIVGSLFFIWMILICFRQNNLFKKQVFAYIFMAFIFAIYFFLSGITMCELPFVIFLIFAFFNKPDIVYRNRKVGKSLNR